MNLEKQGHVGIHFDVMNKEFSIDKTITRGRVFDIAILNYLIDKQVNFIGIDMNGAQKPASHLRIDQHCADRGVFIIENLDKLDLVLEKVSNKPFTAYIFPVNMSGF
ncbi:hypothetical protein [Clostridium estertheticum]|uniref:hypothetical protein n=1 Tax=Clostridium estertheticum TaxID=238834 RepID=UPI00217DECD4|nr:hypothetical protein [Clostridium estertheticum]